MAKIKKIHAREILDSRGNPTVECDITLEDGSFGRAAVPSGASTGIHEALELRDGDKTNYLGKSVQNAVRNINEIIAKELELKEASDHRSIDELMIKLDGTENKSKLGANAILAVSMATAVAESKSRNLELYEYISDFSEKKNEPFVLPYPMMNLMNGGAHAEGASDFQEYMIIPKQSSGFSARLRAGAETFHALKSILKEKGFQTTVGDEGGFAPSLGSNTTPIEYMVEAILKAGYTPGKDIFIGLDVASSEFYENRKYNLKSEGKIITKEELSDYYAKLIEEYPLISIEDAFEQDDYEMWAKFTKDFGDKVQIVGDDFYVTNLKRLQKGIDMQASNSILIKLNQIGSLSETIDAINLAQRNNMTAVVSHRSGETEDTFIADLVVGMRTGQIKTGSLSRSERIAKYNRLLRIEEKILIK